MTTPNEPPTGSVPEPNPQAAGYSPQPPFPPAAPQTPQQPYYADPHAAQQQGYYQQGYDPAQYAQQAYQQFQATARGSDSFFKALFDFSFTQYVTITWAKVLYILAIIGAGIMWVFFAIGSALAGAAPNLMGQGGGIIGGVGGFIGGLIGGGIAAFFMILGARLSIELAVAIVRTARNTTILAEEAQKDQQA
ncbi:MAG: DUF4282 domain-containing protein [Actinomycetaceae bacterium]|nr:DUF4282 domain-containing protein [Actinomycetaceae bacterium]